MKLFKYCFFLIVLSVLSACDLSPTPLDIDIDEPEQRLVVSSFAFPPQEILLTVTRTFSALLGEDSINLEDQDVAARVFVDSALATITYAGRRDTLSKIGTSVFGSVDVEQIFNTKYVLEVKDFKTGQEIRAETVLLPQVLLDTVFPVKRVLFQFGDTIYTFQYRFDDPAGTENYYLVTYTNINTLAEQVQDIAGSLFNFNRTQFHVFTDRNNGDGQPIEFQPEFGGSANDTLLVALSNIPKGYYDFLAAYKRSGNLFSQLTGEPINLPSNVEGGFGYFAMIRPSGKFVILR